MDELTARRLLGNLIGAGENIGAGASSASTPAFAKIDERTLRKLKAVGRSGGPTAKAVNILTSAPSRAGGLGGLVGAPQSAAPNAPKVSNGILAAAAAQNVGAADAFGALAAFDSADADGGGETESKRRKTCENAIDNLRSNPHYSRSDVVIGILFYYNMFGGAQYGGVEVLAVQLNRANSDFPITIPNAKNCEGTKDADELRDCMRRRPIKWSTEPGKIFSFGNSGLPLAGVGKKPFALLVSRALPRASKWAKELNIPRDKILVDTCVGL